MLPQVSVSANTANNRRDHVVRATPLFERPPTKEGYNNHGAQLSITQPLWRPASAFAITQADALVAQADYQRAAAEQDLLVRLAQAWFDAMLARDVVVFSAAQVEAAKHQWRQAEHAVKVGVGAAPAAEEVRAKYDQALAEHIGAETDERLKTAALEQIIGPLPAWAAPSLPAHFAVVDPRPGALDQWLGAVEAASPAVLAATRALEAAREEVSKQRAGHSPTLDVVASYGRNGQGAGSLPGQDAFDTKQRAIGLQLNIPLYAGGGQSAKVGEALATRDRAAYELEATKRSVRLASQQAWFGWQAAAARHNAAEQGVKSSAISLQAALSGKAKGLKVELDVLQASQQLVGALRDLNKARYDMIISQIKLKASAGDLVDGDLTALDALFAKGKDVAAVHQSLALPESAHATQPARQR
jgi:outer membrane protein